MNYNVIKRGNPQKRGEHKFYAAPEYGEIVNIRAIAEDISRSCSLTTSDVIGVVESLIEKLPTYLKNSNKVRLGDLGIMKLSFSSKGQEKAEDVSARDIEGVKILFIPGALLKRALTDVTFSKKGSASVNASESSENAGSSIPKKEESAAEKGGSSEKKE